MTLVGKPGKPLPVAEPIPVKVPAVKRKDDDETVPDNHPIAAAVPEEIAFAVRMKRTALEISEVFERETERDPVTNTRKPGAIARRRKLRVTYELAPSDLRSSRFEVIGEAELRGVEFGADGAPTDAAKWQAIVLEAFEDATDEARKRIEELITGGLEAEEAEAKA